MADLDGGTTIGGLMAYHTGNLLTGSTIFNTTTGVTITHNIGHTNYKVNVTPTSNPAGYLGEVWVTKTATTIVVYCSGTTTTTTFDYMITKY